MSLNAAEIFALCVCLALMPATLPAQNQAAAPGAKPSPSISAPKFTDEQMQEMISKVQDRIRNATDQVMGRIQKAESELYIRFSYFNKPNRLDPNTYSIERRHCVVAAVPSTTQRKRGDS